MPSSHIAAAKARLQPLDLGDQDESSELAEPDIWGISHFDIHRIVKMMDERQALAGFGALSQETRLRIVRLLVQAGPDGVAAGAVGDQVGVSASNVSFHLKDLEHAGLIGARREARSIVYSADFEALSGLLQFLMQDCCGGRPEICSPALAASRCSTDRKGAAHA
jgi:ArsR family transcriptional regulator